MKKIKGYIILESRDRKDLEKKILKELKDRWELYGDLIITRNVLEGNIFTEYIQTMILK